MSYRHYNKGEAYTLDRLIDKLCDAAKAGYGQRRVMVGPVTPDIVRDVVETATDNGEPIGGTAAMGVVGIEINDPPSGEVDLCWLYPGDLEY